MVKVHILRTMLDYSWCIIEGLKLQIYF